MSDNLDLSSVTTIVHDLKTPITSIMGFIELLQKDDHDEEKRQSFYDIIATESSRLLKMVNDVLYVSRTSEQKSKENKNESEVEPCNIGVQIHKYVKELAPLAEKRNINVDINMNESNIYVSIPESKVARILTNIIENAIKYNRESGKVFIDVSEEGNSVVIRIKDTGLGIASEEIDKIFDKFYRSPVSKKMNIDGTGLGLAIAKDIVESYGGEIKVESELGKCTEFMISLPISKFEE